jgi:hypothetical protein
MGIPIARIFGIEIRVQLGWVLVLALIAVIAVGQLSVVDPELETAVSWILGGLVALGFSSAPCRTTSPTPWSRGVAGSTSR